MGSSSSTKKKIQTGSSNSSSVQQTNKTFIEAINTDYSPSDNQIESPVDMASPTPVVETPEDDEVKQCADTNIEILKKCWTILKDGTKLIDENGNYIPTFFNAFSMTYSLLFAYGNFTSAQTHSYSKLMFSYLADDGIIAAICDFVVYVLKDKYNPDDQEGAALLKNYLNCAKYSLSVLTNFTDELSSRSCIVRDHPSYLPFMAKQHQKWNKFIVDGKISKIDAKILQSNMNVIYNMSMNRDNVEKLKSLKFKEILIPYLKISEDPDLRLTSLAALANLVDEKESEILRTDKEVFTFLVVTIETALVDSDHRAFGWSAEELAKVVRRIAKNDNNKRILVELGVLQHLVSLAENEDIAEQREAVKAMWTLSFDEENVKTMIEDISCGVIDTFIKLKSSSKDDKVKRTCNRALWTMREKLAQSERYKKIGQEYMGSKKSSFTDVAKGHVMISYQWNNQDVLKRVRDEVKKKKLSVWMDIDDMEGSTIDAMAAAVEGASVILVCASKRYKDSDNCRAEAQYAWKLKKPIIPLIMERGYKPDGWLGIIFGTDLFFDFSGKYDFESRMVGLTNAIQKILNRGEKTDETDTIVPTQVPSVAATPVAASVHIVQDVHAANHLSVPERAHSATTAEIKSWTSVDVATWLQKHNLPRKKFQTLTGVDVAFLLVLKQEVSGDFFYKTLMDLLKINELSTLSRLRFALDDTSLP